MRFPGTMEADNPQRAPADHRKRFVLSVLSGLLLTGSFPDFGSHWVAWVALIPLLFAVRNLPAGSRFRLGLVAGLAHYLTLTYWLTIAMQTYGGLNVWASIGILCLLATYLALYIGAFSLALGLLARKPLQCLVAAPVLWVVLEFIRAKAITGFPWELLGYSQYQALQIIQISDIFGVYGVSFLVAAVNTGLFLIWLAIRNDNWQDRQIIRNETFVAGLYVILLPLAGLIYGHLRMETIRRDAAGAEQVKAAVIQGNISQDVKWDPEFIIATTDTYLRLSREDIEDITIGFNTAMHHIFLSLDPKHVGRAPFPPVIHHSLDIKARDLGIKINPSSYMFVLPIEAGFVGADNVGVLIAEEPYKQEENQLIIDIGTNGELVLGNRHKLISSSCATGPALEGAQIACGMRAAPGAIERIEIDPETREVDYKVIGRDAWRKFSKPEEMKARGICGSGILDLLAELYRAGVVDKSGAFNKKALEGHARFRINPATNQPEFVLAWCEESSIDKDIVVTQKDIRQIQLAKGALYAGCKLMVKRMGLDRVDKIKIAGAFGTHVDRTKALIMGLFPDCEIEMIESVGNAAGDGCRAALLNIEKRKEANWCSRNVEYIELTIEESFQKEFVEALQLPHMTDKFPHLKGIVPDDILNQ